MGTAEQERSEPDTARSDRSKAARHSRLDIGPSSLRLNSGTHPSRDQNQGDFSGSICFAMSALGARRKISSASLR